MTPTPSSVAPQDLPEPAHWQHHEDATGAEVGPPTPWYSADQMRAARQEAVPAITVADLLAVATGRTRHILAGLCPDEIEGPDVRDGDCPACRILVAAESLAAPPAQQAAAVEAWQPMTMWRALPLDPGAARTAQADGKGGA